jgi:hypothetical protein
MPPPCDKVDRPKLCPDVFPLDVMFFLIHKSLENRLYNKHFLCMRQDRDLMGLYFHISKKCVCVCVCGRDIVDIVTRLCPQDNHHTRIARHWC